MIVAISLDESVEAARACARDEVPTPLTYPVLVDRDHAWAEAYGVINVPATVWVDEHDRVVRPPSIAPGDDKFIEFTKISADIHHDALRRWVHDDVLPMDADAVRSRRAPADAALQEARAERRLAMHLLRVGHEELGHAHLARALELAPDDWTIHRGSMPVRGEDPFGEAFFDFYQRWEAAGRPGYES